MVATTGRYSTRWRQRNNTMSAVSITRLPSVVATTTLRTKCGHASYSRARNVVSTAVGIAVLPTYAIRLV